MNFARQTRATDDAERRDPPPVPRLASGVYRRLTEDEAAAVVAFHDAVQAEQDYDAAPTNGSSPAYVALMAARRRLTGLAHNVARRAARAAGSR